MRVLIDTNVLISAALNASGVPFQAYVKAASYSPETRFRIRKYRRSAGIRGMMVGYRYTRKAAALRTTCFSFREYIVTASE